jgi:signal transduction histidine kinase
VTVSVLDQPSPSLRVSDDGPGLPAAWLNDPSPLRYMRGSNAVLSGVRGAGLGLAIAHEVAARHGGRLELSAGADGHGCVATLHFPDGARQDAASLAAVRTLQVSR